MNNISLDTLQKDISGLFGFNDMTEEERAALLDDIGSTILESATLRFMVENEEGVVTQFEEVLEKNAGNDDMLATLFKTFPRFEEILKEEVLAFKKEAQDVLG